jgi:hypothetical protein
MFVGRRTLRGRHFVPLRLSVVKAPCHLPPAGIELALRAAIQTRTISAAVAGEGSAQVGMPAPKHAGHQAADSTGNGGSMIEWVNGWLGDV